MTVETKGDESQVEDQADDKSTDTEVNPLSLSDDDFLKAPIPAGSEANGNETDKEKVEDQNADDNANDGDKDGDENDADDKSKAGAEDDEKAKTKTSDETDDIKDKSKVEDTDKADKTGKTKASDKDTSKGKKPAAGEETDNKGTDKGSEKDKTGAESTLFQVPNSFKANGKDIVLRSPEEAIKLMQMGANYTRKLQEMAPHRKVLLMIQDNGLTEDKLSYLIDLDKKNPEAIKKLIKDAGIDPLEIDTSTEPKYLGGNHAPTDEETNFRTAVSELSAEPQGKETLVLINTKWDDASKDVLWKSPEIMSVIHEQRENGIYDAITAEMDRRITLGEIPTNTPFLQAYKLVGDEMAAAAMKSTTTAVTGENKPEPKVIDTRAAAPKSKVKDDDKVSAASPTRSTPSKTGEVVNPLAMSDDDFLKSMDKRL